MLKALRNHSFRREHKRKTSFWQTYWSETKLALYYRNLVTGMLQWEEAATTQLHI